MKKKITTSKIKRQMITWGKIFVIQTINERLISLTCKELPPLEDKKIKTATEKCTRIWTIHKEMALMHLKRCSTLHRREMQIKTTVSYHFIPIRLAKIQSLTIYSGSLSHTADENAKRTPSSEGQFGNIYWDYKCIHPLMWQLHFWEFILWWYLPCSKWHVYKVMHHSTVFNNKLMAAIQVVFIYWGLVTQILVLMHWGYSKCGCRPAAPASAVSLEMNAPAIYCRHSWEGPGLHTQWHLQVIPT